MKQPSLKKSIVIALLALQCANLTFAQQQSGGNAVSGADISVPVATTTQPPAPTTTEAQTTTTQPPPQTTTQAPQTTTQPPAVTTTTDVTPSSTTQAPTSDQHTTQAPTTTTRQSSNKSSSVRPDASSAVSAGPNASSSDGTAQATPTDNQTQSNGGNNNNTSTATIAGSVVGGIVGVALIAGFITWMNRRGGCTSRTNRRGRANTSPQDFVNDDYDMAEAGKGTTGAGAGAGAAVAAAAAHNNVDPSSPFQNARRFVPPTSGYMNLVDNDQEYGYHNNAAAGAALAAGGVAGAYAGHQGQQDYYNQQGQEYYHGSQPDYNQEHQHQEYHGGDYNQHPEYAQHHAGGDYGHQDYYDGNANGSVQGYQQQGYYNNNAAGVVPGSNVTSPTLINDSVVGAGGYHHNKPDQIEQKPNEA